MHALGGKINLCDRGWFMLLFDLALAADLRQFGVKFRSDQHGKACPIEPGHQCNACTERSVSFVKVCEMSKVKTEQIGDRKPAAHGKDRARQISLNESRRRCA